MAMVEQTQCIAYSEDGIHFEKYAGNPVITAPEGVSSGSVQRSESMGT